MHLHYAAPRKGNMKGAPSFFGIRRSSSNLIPLLAATLLVALLLSASRLAFSRTSPNTPNTLEELAADPAAALATIRSLQSHLKPGSTGNIVLATAYHTSVARLAIFVNSWAFHSPGTKLVIFTTDELLQDPVVHDLYREHKVESVRFTPPPEIDDATDTEEFAKPGRAVLQSLEQYQIYLETKVSNVRKVAIVIEAGDIALQGDVFVDGAVRYAEQHQQVVFTSEGGLEIKHVPIIDNSGIFKSVMDCYGSTMAEKLGEKPLLNSDFTIGPYSAIHAYVALMADVMGTRVRHKCLRNIRPDIAVLAYVVHSLGADPKYLDFRVAMKAGGASPVLPLPYGMPARIDGHGMVHTVAGVDGGHPHVPSVLAGYSSHPSLLDYLLARYQPSSTELYFVQAPGYQGSQAGLVGLPESWEEAAQKLYVDMVREAGSEGSEDDVAFEDVVDAMAKHAVERRRQRQQAEHVERKQLRETTDAADASESDTTSTTTA